MTTRKFGLISNLARAFKSRRAFPAEVLEASISKSRKLEKWLNVFLSLDEDQARTAAWASKVQWFRGEPSDLDGLPIALKVGAVSFAFTLDQSDLPSECRLQRTRFARMSSDVLPSSSKTARSPCFPTIGLGVRM